MRPEDRPPSPSPAQFQGQLNRPPSLVSIESHVLAFIESQVQPPSPLLAEFQAQQVTPVTAQLQGQPIAPVSTQSQDALDFSIGGDAGFTNTGGNNATTVDHYGGTRVPEEMDSTEFELANVQSIRPSMTISPFAILDSLFLGILRRQPDQDFLKRFLVILVARTEALSGHQDLYRDDAMLMHVSKKQLHAKLREMHRLLKFEPHISLRHQSFLDFLRTASRSREYYVGERRGTKRYFEAFVDSFVRYVSNVIEQPNYHNTSHFNPKFSYICFDPRTSWRPTQQWPGALQPLLRLWDRLLKLPNFVSIRKFLSCDKCIISDVMQNILLHMEFNQCPTSAPSVEAADSAMNDKGKRSAVPLVSAEAVQGMSKHDLDTCLSSFLTHIRLMKLETLNVVMIMNHTYSLLCFDPAEIAMRVRSVSDAQKLVDVISHKNILNQYNQELAWKASQVAFKVFSRVPTLPISLFLNGAHKSSYHSSAVDFQILCQTAFAGKMLNRSYIIPVVKIRKDGDDFRLFYGNDDVHEELVMIWRSRSRPTSSATLQVILEVARGIQYLHSVGVAIFHTFHPGNVLLDSELRPKFRCLFSISPDLSYKSGTEQYSYEGNIFSFGCFFYGVYFNIYVDPSESVEYRRVFVAERPPKTKIPEYAWQLIQHCCAEDPMNRPTIDEVVQEMESWRAA